MTRVTTVWPDVLVVSQVPPPLHGQTLMTKRTLDLLARAGCRLRLVDRRFSRTIDEVGAVGVRKVLAAFGLVGRLVGRVLRRRPDVVVLFATTRPVSFAVDVVLVRTLRVLRVPVVLSVHSIGFCAIASRSRIGSAAVRSMLGAVAAVVCLGPSLAGDVRPFVRPERIRVIRNTPTEVPSIVERGHDDRCRTVLWLSNVMPGKGAEVFAEVACALGAQEDVEYRMVGPVADHGTAEAVRERVARGDLDGRFRMVGAVYDDAKWAALRSASVLAFTSELDEAQPLTIVEAMACGLPVVAFDRGGIADVVEHGVTGLLAPPGDTATFTDHVRSVLDDPALAARLRRGAFEAYAARHAPAAHVRAWRELLDEFPVTPPTTTASRRNA
ncbi:glycosyltransferase family 4 protein [Curtobacterium sp. MCBD17_023]|uniref:glycosyltransferase family 4 protein n=1 Tax=Curtobacterium sp. MCBD17_023 TaxID=2175657 RepID=UPI000D8C4B63|nr:glycosyltransferase family 4 protein [Curtobacterium sp. MCBD17_023]PYY48278.1 hypothetical protein DEI84_09830 [Curtobacterium sp. MCBD17_023]